MIRTQPLPWIGECYADEARPFSQQDICNWLPSQAEVQGTLTPMMAKTPPGLFPYLEIPGTVVPPEGETPGYTIPSKPVRGTYNCENKLFAVIGNTQYQISNSGVAIPVGTIPGVTRTQSAHNQITLGNQLVTVNGSAGYCYNTATQVFERITDPGFAGGITAKFIDGYILCIEPGRRFVGHSDLANALEWNTLDRFTSEYKPDLLVTDAVISNEYLVFSEQSAEWFVNTGASQQPFRTKRVYMDVGCSGRYNAATLDNSVLWHGSDGKFYELEGYGPRRISTRPIEQAVRGLNWSQAFAEVWDDAGHSVVYWTFPGGHTWGFDRATRKWHRRASLAMDRWRVNTLTKWKQDWYAGDFQTGRIWRLDWDYILEGEDEFVSECTGPVIHNSQNPLTMVRCEPLLDVGHELTVPGAFPVQPERPSITGNAPDGAVGVAWGPYSYSATGGTAPYTYSLRPGSAVPAGLPTLTTAGVLPAGTPTTEATYTVIVRVTDSTGLWDELTDTIQIRLVDPYWDYVISLLHLQGADGSNTYDDEKPVTWVYPDEPTNPLSCSLSEEISFLEAQETSLEFTPIVGGVAPQINSNSIGAGFWAGDFTVEFRVRFKSVSTIQSVWSADDASPFDLSIQNNNGVWRVYGPGVAISYISGGTIAADTDYAVALVRSGTTLRLFVDGVSIGTGTFAHTTAATDSFFIYGYDPSAGDCDMYLGEARITKTICRYAANYTPALTPFPNEGPP